MVFFRQGLGFEFFQFGVEIVLYLRFLNQYVKELYQCDLGDFLFLGVVGQFFRYYIFVFFFTWQAILEIESVFLFYSKEGG